jgi:hypothetical protein
MPIKKENRKRYPKNWKEISEDIRFNRAQNKCENCGAINHSFVNRFTREICLEHDENSVQIILTVGHLDHTPEHNDYSNLKAMCQKCHNTYDAPHRRQTFKKSKLVGQLKLAI